MYERLTGFSSEDVLGRDVRETTKIVRQDNDSITTQLKKGKVSVGGEGSRRELSLHRVRTGPVSAWKYLKFITVFSRSWNPWKIAPFWSRCLKVREFPLDNKSYDLLQSSVNISVEEFYQIPQCTVFAAFPVLRCSVTIFINQKQMVLEKSYLVLESPWKILDFYV